MAAKIEHELKAAFPKDKDDSFDKTKMKVKFGVRARLWAFLRDHAISSSFIWVSRKQNNQTHFTTILNFRGGNFTFFLLWNPGKKYTKPGETGHQKWEQNSLRDPRTPPADVSHSVDVRVVDNKTPSLTGNDTVFTHNLQTTSFILHKLTVPGLWYTLVV